MELVERNSYLDVLAHRYRQTENGGGHSVFLAGEAGVGKTSLVNYFLSEMQGPATVYTGACDSLFTPRPLGPLYDIAAQTGGEFLDLLRHEKDRSLIFASFVQMLAASPVPVVLVFEDIHWADEATIDFIKFLARRITRIRCLFLLTYRDDEIHARHPLKTLFGELPSPAFTKLAVQAFSREAVDALAQERGLSGDKIYALTGGNPFYVTEILASEKTGIPERVKDSILTVFHSKDEDMQARWEMLSILPSRIEYSLAERIDPDFQQGLENCLRSGVVVQRKDYIAFKHELFRLAIEESLSPYRRKNLHRMILKIMLESAPGTISLSQLLHHARFADDREQVAKIAPQAAQEAASLGAHIEASKLYLTAIEYTDKNDPQIASLYEHHAYECHLINQMPAAIASQEQALALWRQHNVSLRIGDTLRFLSRLRWMVGNRAEAITLALESIRVLENGFPTRERALAYSNLSQLKMLSDDLQETLHWGEKAIGLASRLNDQEILAHALNNVGSVLMKFPGSESEGEAKVKESLAIALRHGYHEHAARAYTNHVSFSLVIKHYAQARAVFEAALAYCDQRDLVLWSYYLMSEKTKLLLETGAWQEAESIAVSLQSNPVHITLTRIGATATLARLRIRQGKFDEARALIQEGQAMARPTGEAFRVVPVLTAALELCWTTGEAVPTDALDAALQTLPERNNSWHYTAIAYWMRKCGLPVPTNEEVAFVGPFVLENQGRWNDAAQAWEALGCPFERALALLEGDEEHQKQGLHQLDALGATATRDRVKARLREQGMRNIPRGPRESTRSNPAQLTGRQVEILTLLQGGAPNKEIADKLFISPKTVDHHITAILSKLDVNSRAKAVIEAQKLGILK